MIAYHGSTEIIEHPDVNHSKNYLDFGRGFYLTTFKEQSEKWAKRKGMRLSKPGIVNVYELSEDLSTFKTLNFEGEDEKWLDFVCSCRKGETKYKEFDIIIGNVADDNVFKVLDMYFRGFIPKERALKEIHYYKLNNQICITNQEVLNTVLKFKESYVIQG